MEEVVDIKIEDVSSVKKVIELSVDAETVKEKFDEYFKSIRKNVIMDGFRKGSVPVSILQSKFGGEAKKLISKSIISESYSTLLKDYNIVPIGNPDIENNDGVFGNFSPENVFSAKMTIEVLPKVDPKGYDDIDLSDVKRENVEEIFNKSLEGLQEQFAEKTQSTDPAKIGDSVVIDFKGFLDGTPFNGGEASGHSIDKLGSGSTVPGFEDQIVGMTAGEEKRISLKFPEDYGYDFLAGKDVEFDIKLHTVIKSKKAEIDEDLAAMNGFDNVDDMMKDFKKKSEEQEQQIFNLRSEAVITEKLVKENDFELPDALINEETIQLSKKFQNMSTDDIKEQAVKNCKKALLLDAIYEKENLTIDPNELDKYLEEQAGLINKSKDELVSLLHNTNQMDAFLGTLRSQKAMEFIINKNTNKESEEADG